MKLSRGDFRLDVILMLGASISVVLTGFALYRLSQGQVGFALLDFGIVAGVLAVLAYAWFSGRSGLAGRILSLVTSTSCLLACWFIGIQALPWVPLVLVTNFFITSRRWALVLNLLVVIGSGLMGPLYASPFHHASAFITTALITAFCYIFAARSHHDRSQLQELASVDALSGVPNRRSMEKMLEAIAAEPRAPMRRYGLIVLDVDRFKEVNDLYGHSAGDTAIADLASILRYEMRKQDQVFRFGGEEFVVLLQAASRAELEAATERLRKAVRGSLRGPGGRITISLGAALLGQERNWHDWFSRADAALYRAKSNGRDNYVIAEDLF